MVDVNQLPILVHTQEEHVETSESEGGHEQVEEYEQEHSNYPIALETGEVPVELGHVSSGHLRQRSLEPQECHVHYEDPVRIQEGLNTKG